jgi:hypothetical protein
VRVLATEKMKTNADYSLYRKNAYSKNHNLESYANKIQVMHSTNFLQRFTD